MTPEQRKLHDTLIKQAADAGKVIELGFIALRFEAMSPNAPEIQVSEMRLAYMAGAQHLFSSIMTMLDPDSEPTERDMRRMTQISRELAAYGQELKLRYEPAEGNAN